MPSGIEIHQQTPHLRISSSFGAAAPSRCSIYPIRWTFILLPLKPIGQRPPRTFYQPAGSLALGCCSTLHAIHVGLLETFVLLVQRLGRSGKARSVLARGAGVSNARPSAIAAAASRLPERPGASHTDAALRHLPAALCT